MCPCKPISAGQTRLIRGHRKTKIYFRRRRATGSSIPRNVEVSRSSCTFVKFSLYSEPNLVQTMGLVDRKIVPFDAFRRPLHDLNRIAKFLLSASIHRHVPTGNSRYPQQPTSSPALFAPMPMAMNLAPVRHMHSSLLGNDPYESGSNNSKSSSMMPKPYGTKRSRGATIPPFISASKPALQFSYRGRRGIEGNPRQQAPIPTTNTSVHRSRNTCRRFVFTPRY
jgi:hypothetical protein